MSKKERKHGYWWIVKEGQNTEGVCPSMGLKEIGQVNGEYFYIPLVTVEAYDEHDKPGVETFESIRYFANCKQELKMSKIVDIRVNLSVSHPAYVSISDLRPGDIVISGTMWQPEWGYCTVGSDNIFRVVEVPEEVALEAIELEVVAYHDLSRQFRGVLA